MKKRLILGGFMAVLITATGLSGVALVSADTAHTANHHAKTKQATRHIRVNARLNQAVRDGTITDNQKTALENELKTLKAERAQDISKTSTKTERQAEQSKLKNELQSWASTNNFPLAKIFPKLAN